MQTVVRVKAALGHISTAETLPPPSLVIILYRNTVKHVMFKTWNAFSITVYFMLFVFNMDERIFHKKEKKNEGRKGYMTQNITTSQVINEHCSCCHGNYYHSNVANGI